MSSQNAKLQERDGQPLVYTFMGNETVQAGKKRPWVEQMAQPPKYGTNQNVWITVDGKREGPFVVSSVDTSSSPPTYYLETEDGTEVNEGRGFLESQISR